MIIYYDLKLEPLTSMIISILTTIYVVLGMIFFMWNKDRLVIKKRVPVLVVTYQIFLLGVQIIVLMELEWNVIDSSKMDCYSRYILEAFWSFLASVSITVFLAQKFSLGREYLAVKLSQLFLNKSRKTSSLKIAILSCILGLSSILYSIFYFLFDKQALANQFQSEIMTDTAFVEILNLIMFSVLFMMSLRILQARQLDHIGAGLEVIGFTALLFFLACAAPLVAVEKKKLWFIYIECILIVFFGLYFPLIINAVHLKQVRFKSTATLDDPRLQEVCKRLYCDELHYYLKRFKEFQNGNVVGDDLIRQFIERGSPCELNISEDLRIFLLKAESEDEIKKGLQSVYKEVCQLLRDSILPYLHNENV
eukprot:NODE_1068_length_2347_cov_0.425267.p1 type:complete len:365 gc:universal NODE_1068_length_2347_cov_0.425267:545-1639(+)